MADHHSTGSVCDADARVFVRRSVDRNTCVEAGAGTGKTSVLVDRVLRVVASGRTTLDRVAIITFTKKAADDVGLRLHEAIAASCDAVDDEDARVLLARAKASRPAHIGTVRAFAEDLLRSHPVEAGLDPTFKVADPVAAGLRYESERHEWLRSLLDEAPPALDRALASGVTVDQLSSLAGTLSEFRDLSVDFWPVPRPDARAALAELRAHVGELAQLRTKCIDPEADRGARQIDELTGFVTDADSLCRVEPRQGDADECGLERDGLERDGLQWDGLEWHLLHNGPLEVRRLGDARNWRPSDACRAQKDLSARVGQVLHTFRRDTRTHALCNILPLVSEFVERSDARRGRDGLATFDDILVRARDLLRDHPAVRTALSDRYRCILVDDFQDTDPLLAEIVMWLTAPGQHATDWLDLEPEAGRLFVVGDPRQSVCRFRRADMAVYERVVSDVFDRPATRPEGASGTALLQSNFRSLPGVLDWVNGTFAGVFSPSPGIQPAYSSLQAALPQPASLTSRGWQSVVAVYEQAHSDHVDTVREQEAALLGDTLAETVGKGAWQVRDRRSGELRRAQWEDVAVLARERTGMVFYEEALAGRGIPFHHVGGVNLCDRQEVRDLMAVLHAVDRPDDPVRFLAALRSIALGCSDDDIFRAHANGLPLRSTATPGDHTPASVTQAINVVQRLAAYRQRPLVELVYRAIDTTNLADTVSTLPNGAQLAANVDAVLDVARAFVAGGGDGLTSFLEWMESGTTTEDLHTGDDDEDGVRLLTMHEAKGLEFPIVAIVDLYRQRTSLPTVVPDREHGRLHLRVGNPGTGARTPGFDDRADIEAIRADAELRRLLYVAATRARDRLVFPLAIPQRLSANDMLSWVLPHLIEDAHDREAVRPAPGVLVLTPSQPSADHEANALPPQPVAGDQADPAGAHPTPPDPAAVARAAKTMERWRLERAETLTAGTRGRVVTAVGAVGNSPGDEHVRTVANAVVSRVAERPTLADDADLDTLVRAIAGDASHASADIEDLARAILSTDVVQRAVGSQTVLASPTLTVPTDEGFLEGHLDLVFAEEAGLVAVVITPDAMPAEGAERHSLATPRHAAACMSALASATGQPVSEYTVVFAGSRGEHTITWANATAITATTAPIP